MKIIGTVVRLAGLAATAYTGYGIYTWLRYGRPKKVQAKTALDRFMPEPEVIEHHAIAVNAPTETTYDTCCAFDVSTSRIAQVLFDTRAYALGSTPAHIHLPARLVDQMKALGWTVLEETPGHEIVFGIASNPWPADPAFRSIPSDQF